MGCGCIETFEEITRQIDLHKIVIDGQLNQQAYLFSEIRRGLIRKPVAQEENQAVRDTFNWLRERYIDTRTLL